MPHPRANAANDQRRVHRAELVDKDGTLGEVGTALAAALPSSPSPGVSSARTFFYFGDGTAGTVALPTGVTTHATDKPGAYVQGGRAYWFGAVLIDLDTTEGANRVAAGGPAALIDLPGGLVPSALEMPSDAGLVGIGQVWADSGIGWQVGFYVLDESLFLVVPGQALAQSGDPFPTTGGLQVYLTPLTWDIQGTTPI
jgi:hypothetical protein